MHAWKEAVWIKNSDFLEGGAPVVIAPKIKHIGIDVVLV